MDCMTPKDFAKHAGEEFTCQKRGLVVFVFFFCDVDQRRAALEDRFDRITCVKRRLLQKKRMRTRDNVQAMPYAETSV